MKISLFYKNVTVLDYAYLDDHRGVVGDALKVHVEFIGKTDEEGVVYDFSYAKKKVKEIIDRDCDHRLVVPKDLVEKIDGDRIRFNYSFGLSDMPLEYECPSEGVCELPSFHVNKATMASHLENLILKEMPETVSAIKLTLEDESLDEGKPTFHYTHGLKEHYGNCQRLFHGHKNTVDVFVNGKERRDLEEYLATELFQNSIHFCKWENVQNKEEILPLLKNQSPVGRFSQIPRVEIAYTSGQGNFKGSLPGAEVFLMTEESTVENLSMLFAKIIKEKVGDERVMVRAYEGVAKGAISTI
jgi:6-pyruvoyl-tetrahydropterin synthase